MEICPPLCVAPSRGLLRHACQVEIDAHYSAPNRSTGIICEDHLRLLHPSGLPRTSAAHPLQGPRVRQDAGLHHQQLLASGRHHLRALQKPLDIFLRIGDNCIPSIPELDREECPETTPDINPQTQRVAGVQVEPAGMGGPTMVPRTVREHSNLRKWHELKGFCVWRKTGVAFCRINSVSHSG